MTTDNDEVISTLNDLIETCRDGEKWCQIVKPRFNAVVLDCSDGTSSKLHRIPGQIQGHVSGRT